MVEHFTSTPPCVSLFFLSRTKFPQNATSPLIRNNVPFQHTKQTIPDTTAFQKKMLLFFLKCTRTTVQWLMIMIIDENDEYTEHIYHGLENYIIIIFFFFFSVTIQ